MKKFLLLSLLLYCCLNTLSAQELVRTKNKYTYKDQILSAKELKHLYQSTPQAYQHYKKANRKFALSSGLIVLGGVYLGGRLGYLTSTGNLEWKEASLGAGLVLIGIWVSSGTNEEYNKAVTLFNQKKSAGLKITPSKKGLGVVFRF
mgnify:FL=1